MSRLGVLVAILFVLVLIAFPPGCPVRTVGAVTVDTSGEGIPTTQAYDVVQAYVRSEGRDAKLYLPTVPPALAAVSRTGPFSLENPQLGRTHRRIVAIQPTQAKAQGTGGDPELDRLKLTFFDGKRSLRGAVLYHILVSVRCDDGSVESFWISLRPQDGAWWIVPRRTDGSATR